MKNQVYPIDSSSAAIIDTDFVPSYKKIDEETYVLAMEATEKAGKEAADDKVEVDYVCLTKEEVILLSNTLAWNRARAISILSMWLLMLALFVTVVVLTVIAPRCQSKPTPQWWQNAVLYQVYPKSFFDADSDGVGDIKGITMKLDYLKDLGINGLILGSVYQSQDLPGLNDFGYDVLNHTNVNPLVGTLQDLQELITQAHSIGLKVIIDFVPNYTGSDHTWFLQSSQATNYNNPFWNAYVWTDQSPNNWVRVYNGSAWVNSPINNRFYFRNFLDSQPELNLRSSKVQSELESILRYWLSEGVDGFRIVQSQRLVESADLQDEGILCSDLDSYDCLDHSATEYQPENFDLFTRWRNLLQEYTDSQRILLTNARVNDSTRLKYLGGNSLDGVHLPAFFLFDRLDADQLTGNSTAAIINPWIQSLPSSATSLWMTSDEDTTRLRSAYSAELMQSLLLLRLSLPGSCALYYGEEVGMQDTSPSPLYDPASTYGMGRDGYRVPFSWTNDSTTAGFSNASQSWLSIDANQNPWNLESQLSDDNGIFSFVRRLLRLRGSEGGLQFGAYHPVATHNNIFAFVREHEGVNRLLIAMNFGGNMTEPVNLRSSSFYIPYRAKVVLVTNPLMTLKTEDDVDLEKASLLTRGDGFVVSWPYERP